MKGAYQFLLTVVVLLVISVVAEADICPNKNQTDVILLPNPDDCHTFYICVDGIPYLMRCPDGLAFNPIDRVCDVPEHVNCKTFYVPTTATASEEDTDFEDIFEDEDDEFQNRRKSITPQFD